MRDTSIVSPGILSNGFLLRREAAKAISAVEIATSRTASGKTVGAAKLAAFFTDCASKLSTMYELVASVVTTRVATSSVLATITFDVALEPSTSVPLSAFTIDARVLTAVEVVGSTVLITGVDITAADTVTYTPPATYTSAGNPTPQSDGIRDINGNLVETFTGALA
jgi:hypothetical protein